jgi:hypothetical protein
MVITVRPFISARSDTCTASSLSASSALVACHSQNTSDLNKSQDAAAANCFAAAAVQLLLMLMLMLLLMLLPLLPPMSTIPRPI